MAAYRSGAIQWQYRALRACETMKKTAFATIFRAGALP